MTDKIERPGRLDEAAATKPIHSGNQTGVDDISMREIRFSRYAKQLEAEKTGLLGRLTIAKSNEDYEQNKREELEARIEKAIALHRADDTHCAIEGSWHPCTTIRILRGEGT